MSCEIDLCGAMGNRACVFIIIVMKQRSRCRRSFLFNGKSEVFYLVRKVKGQRLSNVCREN